MIYSFLLKIELVGTRPLHIATYNRPKENDAYSADKFRPSLEMVSKENGDIWVLGDLNYPFIEIVSYRPFRYFL